MFIVDEYETEELAREDRNRWRKAKQKLRESFDPDRNEPEPDEDEE